MNRAMASDSEIEPGSPCPVKVLSRFPLEVSQMRTVWSPLDVASLFPLYSRLSYYLIMRMSMGINENIKAVSQIKCECVFILWIELAGGDPVLVSLSNERQLTALQLPDLPSSVIAARAELRSVRM